MKPTYQRVIHPTNGDCVKCCLCTLLDLEYDDVPNFAEHSNMWLYVINFCEKLGYEYNSGAYMNGKVQFLENPIDCCYNKLIDTVDASHLYLQSAKPEESYNGLFIAGVYSPGYTNINDHPSSHLHCVLCDTDFNIVFDPNPNYQDIIRYPYSELIGYNGIRCIDIIKKL